MGEIKGGNVSSQSLPPDSGISLEPAGFTPEPGTFGGIIVPDFRLITDMSFGLSGGLLTDRLELMADISAEEAALREKFATANEKRDYSIYKGLMDAALPDKLRALAPYFPEIAHGDIIVDAGSGTGLVAENIARIFRGARVCALDISHELREQAAQNQSLIELVHGNAMEQNFPDNSVSVIYFSTSGHEIESFGGEGGMIKAMEASFKQLRPGGRALNRDFLKPSQTKPLYMDIMTEVGEDLPDGFKGGIDYSKLSSAALFKRFHQEFGGGNKFEYKVVQCDGRSYILILPEWAYEFYMRKDYTANWRNEIKEKYCYWTIEDAYKVMQEIGFVDVQVVEMPSQYILQNRLEGKIGLYDGDPLSGLVKSRFPSTHMLVIGTKPYAPSSRSVFGTIHPGKLNYQQLLDSIKIEKQKVQIGDREFNFEGEPLVGLKKIIYPLGKDSVLKVVRSDTYNQHNAFRSMYQIVERQKLLDEFEIPHLKTREFDKQGPPYRWLIQERLPAGAVAAAELIKSGELAEEEIRQICEIVKRVESSKQWQLDMNPHSWFRVVDENGKSKMVYVAGKVYKYDERWEFGKKGLIQWTDAAYLDGESNFTAKIPTLNEYADFSDKWDKPEGILAYWKNCLRGCESKYNS